MRMIPSTLAKRFDTTNMSFIVNLLPYRYKGPLAMRPTQTTATFRGNRRLFIGGSDARIIMGDDEEALLRLWREKRGEAQPEDLTGNLIVQLGVVT
jgi:hypothetical protein